MITRITIRKITWLFTDIGEFLYCSRLCCSRFWSNGLKSKSYLTALIICLLKCHCFWIFLSGLNLPCTFYYLVVAVSADVMIFIVSFSHAFVLSPVNNSLHFYYNSFHFNGWILSCVFIVLFIICCEFISYLVKALIIV